MNGYQVYVKNFEGPIWVNALFYLEKRSKLVDEVDVVFYNKPESGKSGEGTISEQGRIAAMFDRGSVVAILKLSPEEY